MSSVVAAARQEREVPERPETQTLAVVVAAVTARHPAAAAAVLGVSSQLPALLTAAAIRARKGEASNGNVG